MRYVDPKLLNETLKRLGATRRQYDLCAFSDELSRTRFPDAAARPGDQHGLAIKCSHADAFLASSIVSANFADASCRLFAEAS